MSDGWISFDFSTGKLIGLSWKKPQTGSSISIPKDVAISFMLGNEKLHEYQVIDNELQKISVANMTAASFWSLHESDDSINGIEIQHSKDAIYVMYAEGKEDIMIYATIKNNPSWLIRSWKLSDNQFHYEAGLFCTTFENAENYSYYIGKVK